MKDKRIKHNMSNTKFYTRWAGMKRRCLNPNRADYKSYGGRGIKVCKSWLDFKNFKRDMYKSYQSHTKTHGEKNTTLERKNVNNNYSPSNCIWTTWKEQFGNQRRTLKITYNGHTGTIRDWVLKTGLSSSLLRTRIDRGWSMERIFSTPPRYKTSSSYKTSYKWFAAELHAKRKGW